MRVSRWWFAGLGAGTLSVRVVAAVSWPVVSCVREQRGILLRGAYAGVPDRAGYAAWSLCSDNGGRLSNGIVAPFRSE